MWSTSNPQLGHVSLLRLRREITVYWIPSNACKFSEKLITDAPKHENFYRRFDKQFWGQDEEFHTDTLPHNLQITNDPQSQGGLFI
jgi:hypothetical protein